jgi:hypothetical protein
MPQVKLPDGTQLNFPDGMSEDDMRGAIEANFPQFAAPKEPAGPPGMLTRIAQAIKDYPILAPGEDDPGVMGRAKPEDLAPKAPASMGPMYDKAYGKVLADEYADPLDPRLAAIKPADALAKMQVAASQQHAAGDSMWARVLEDAAREKDRDAADMREKLATYSPENLAGNTVKNVRNVTAGVLKIGPSALKGVFDIAQLATGGKVGTAGSASMAEGMKAIDEAIADPTLGQQGQEFQALMADPNADLTDMYQFLKANPEILLDNGITTIGSMYLPAGVARGAIGVAGRLGASAATAGAVATAASVGTVAAQNAADTFTSDPLANADLSDKYRAAAFSAGMSVLAGMIFHGGAEGEIARRMAGVKPSPGSKLAGIGKAAFNEGAQEMGEEIGNAGGETIGSGNYAGDNNTAKRIAFAGALGAMFGTVSHASGAGEHAHIDDGSAAAEAARQAALAKWGNNGLSPNQAAPDVPGARIEPTLNDITNPPTPPAAPAPTVADIGAATSVDDAIAAAQAVLAQPITGPSSSVHATAADIDALEQAAGMGGMLDQATAATPSATLTGDPARAMLEQLGHIPAAPIAEPAAAASPEPSVWRRANDPAIPTLNDQLAGPDGIPTLTDELPGQAPIPTLKDVFSTRDQDGQEWHHFPEDTGTLGIPRADMPQIKAEHRGALVNFLNARGITHDQVEVPPHSLKPTQAEFSLDKVQKALDYQGGNRSILTSSDGHVLDGHHQWLGDVDQGSPTKAIRLNAPIRQLLDVVKEFPSATVSNGATSAEPATGWRATEFAPRIDKMLGDLRAAGVNGMADAIEKGVEMDAKHGLLKEDSVAFREGKARQAIADHARDGGNVQPAPFTPMTVEKFGDITNTARALPEPIVAAAVKKWNAIAPKLAELGYQPGEAHSNAPQAARDLQRQLTNITQALDGLAPRRYQAAKGHKNLKPGHLQRAEEFASATLGIKTKRYPGVDTSAPITLGRGVTPAEERAQEARRRAEQLRERLRSSNPFLAFLANHGVSPADRADLGVEKGARGNPPVPGYGPVIRKTGKRLDELALLAEEAGFITKRDIESDDDTGGTRKLASMIQRALANKEVLQQPTAIDGAMPTADERLADEARALGIDTEGKTADQLYDEVQAAHQAKEDRRETNGAESVHDQALIEDYADVITSNELADAHLDDIDLDAAGVPMNNLTDEEIDAIFGLQNPGRTQEDRGETEGHAAVDARQGAEGTAAADEGPGGDLLTSYSAADVVARQDAEEAAAKARQAERDRLEQQRKREDDAKQTRARIEDSADNFQLGQSAESAVFGQDSLFDHQAPVDDAAIDRAATAGYQAGQRGSMAPPLNLDGDELAAWRIGNKRAIDEAIGRPNAGEQADTALAELKANPEPIEQDSEPIDQPRVHKYNPENARPLLLIACSGAKLDGRHKAADLYQGVMFDVLRKWMPTEGVRPDVYVISAEHGLVHGDTLLNSYERPMDKDRQRQLIDKGLDVNAFKGKDFNQVFVAGGELYRGLAQTYIERLRQAGFIGQNADVKTVSGGIGEQRGQLGEYLRQLNANPAEDVQVQASSSEQEKPLQGQLPDLTGQETAVEIGEMEAKPAGDLSEMFHAILEEEAEAMGLNPAPEDRSAMFHSILEEEADAMGLNDQAEADQAAGLEAEKAKIKKQRAPAKTIANNTFATPDQEAGRLNAMLTVERVKKAKKSARTQDERRRLEKERLAAMQDLAKLPAGRFTQHALDAIRMQLRNNNTIEGLLNGPDSVLTKLETRALEQIEQAKKDGKTFDQAYDFYNRDGDAMLSPEYFSILWDGKGENLEKQQAKSKGAAKVNKQRAAEQRMQLVLGAKVGDTITMTFKGNVGYLTSGKPMTIERVSSTGEIYFKDAEGDSRTSEKLAMLEAYSKNKHTALKWEVTPRDTGILTSKEEAANQARAYWSESRDPVQRALVRPIAELQKIPDVYQSLVQAGDIAPQVAEHIAERRRDLRGEVNAVMRDELGYRKKAGEWVKDNRTAGQAAADAVKNTAIGYAAALGGIGEALGIAPKKLGVMPFDETKYQRVQPYFSAAVSALGEAVHDIKTVMRVIVRDLLKLYGKEGTAQMEPYVLRYIDDWEDGKIKLNGESDNADIGTDKRAERDSSDRPNGEPETEPDVFDVRHGQGRGARAPGAGPAEAGPGSADRAGVPGRDAAPGRAQGDRGVSDVDGSNGPAASAAEPRDAGGSGDRGNPRAQSESDAIGEPATALGARLSLDEKRQQQLAAEKVDVVPGDRANIDATLPYLLDGQRDDVHFAETRFANPDKGPGVLFTNGTGTGKTFTGLGIAKRFERMGKGNGIIVVPNNEIAKDWIASGEALGLNIRALESTSEHGDSGMVITTYANFGNNPTLADREWDFVLPDEAHYLMASKDGKMTDALQTLRALTRHPEGFARYSRMVNRDLFEQLAAVPNKDSEQAKKLWDELRKREEPQREDFAAVAGSNLARPKAVFLSATPFAYIKAVDWAEGYLFSYPADGKIGNSNQDGRAHFFVQHFGYRIRYHKLTEPDANVDQGLMARQFNSWLKKEGALSGRLLDVEADYDRKFVMIPSALGTKIDEGLEFVRAHPEYKHLYQPLMKQFDYLSRRYLLEAIKAKESLPMIQDHLDAGRKVIIVHDYKKGGAFNPFTMQGVNGTTGYWDGNNYKEINLADLADQFKAERSDLVNLKFPTQSALQILTGAFPVALVHNGDVAPRQLEANKRLFNADNFDNPIIILQADKGREGISLHDTIGRHMRVQVNVGMPGKPTALIQLEGRSYRTGQVTDAAMRYVSTGTMWERWTFAQTIAERADIAEALAMGDLARGLKESIIEAYEDAGPHPVSDQDGKGGKARDRQLAQLLTEWDRAKSFYYGQLKRNSSTKAAEGKDYFATPEPVGLKMVEWADIRPGESVLEPSAGHGAIARWFPIQSAKTIVEPETPLITKARLAVDGPAKFVQSNFEDLHLVNKYDTIVMNPPFGKGGSLSTPHLAKAYKHLNEGGRIVALLPAGPDADKRFEKFMYGDDAPKDLHLVAHIMLPSATFNRAGTGAMTRIVVLDKLADADQAPNPMYRDYTHVEDVEGLFDAIEPLTLPGRAKTDTGEDIAIEEAKPQPAAKPAKVAKQAAPGATGAARYFAQFEFDHTKTGAKMYGASMLNRVSMDAYKDANAIAKQNGGYYNKFASGDAKRGFLFKTDAERQAFIEQAGKLDEVSAGLDAQNSLSGDLGMDSALLDHMEQIADHRGMFQADKLLEWVRHQDAPGAAGLANWLEVQRDALVTPSSVVKYLENSGNEMFSKFDPGRRQVLAAAAAAAIAPTAAAGDVKLGQTKPLPAGVLAQRVAPSIEKLLRDGQASGTTSLNGLEALRKALKAMSLTGPKEVRNLAMQVHDLLPTSGTMLLTVDDARHMNVHGVVSLAPMLHMQLFTAGGRAGLTYETVLHEAMHVAIAARYRSLSVGLERGNDKLLGMSAPAAAKALAQFEGLWNEFRQLTAGEKFGNSTLELAVAEARGNPDEFFVRTLTDPVLQAYLASKRYEGKTMWERFKDWVKTSLFGLRESGTAPSWLDAALYASGDLTEAMGGDRADFARMRAVSRYQDQASTIDAGPDHMAARASSVAPTWTDPAMTMQDTIIQTLQDKHVDMKRIVQSIREQAGQIADKWDPYLQEELFHGRAATGFKSFLTDELRPLLTDMQARGVSMQELEQYLVMRHAEEANDQIASINPGMPDGGSGIDTADARAYLANMSPAQRQAYGALAARVDAIIAGTQRALVDYGLEKQDTIDTWNRTYQHYVPLMREDMDSPLQGNGTGSGFSVRGPASKRRMGSDRNVINVLANVAMARERAIVRGEKNRLDLALYGLALQAPNPDFWKPINPQKNPQALQGELVRMGLSPALVQTIIDEPKQRVIDPNTGMVVNRVNPLLRNAPNVVAVRVNGEDRFIFFNERSERAMRMAIALKNLGNDGLNRFLNVMGMATRWFASINTQYNPVFGIVNFTRDLGEGSINLASTPIAGQQGAFVKEAGRLFGAVARHGFNLEKLGGADLALWHEFEKEGGITGYRAMFSTSDDRARELAKEMRAMQSGQVKKAGRAVLDWLSDYNEALENVTRLAAYKTAKANGMTNQQAASLAKNLTVNFNRKGAVGSQINSLFAFFNAATQGIARMAETIDPRTTHGKAIIGGGILLGVLQAFMMLGAGYDDDNPPEFVKARNFVIPLGWATGKKDYLTIPYPLGYSFLPTIGRVTTEFGIGGGKKIGKHLADIGGALADTFNPIGNGNLVQIMTPTVADPIVDLAINQDWTGKPIARQDRSSLHPTPGFTRTKDTASGFGKATAYYLNAITGGNKYQAGLFSPTPDQVDYLAGQLTGGVGREALKAWQTGASLVTGEDLPAYKVPLAGRFYGQANDKSAVSTKFYENLKELNSMGDELEGRAKDHADPKAYLAEHPEARLAKLGESVETDIAHLRKRKSELMEKGASRDRIKENELQQRKLMERFNTKVEEVKAKSAP